MDPKAPKGSFLDDTILVDEKALRSISKVWKWLLDRFSNGLPLSVIGYLWLVPCQSRHLRRLVPSKKDNFATYFSPNKFKASEIYLSLMKNANAPQVIDDQLVGHDAMSLLLHQAKTDTTLQILQGDCLSGLVSFLHEARTIIQEGDHHSKKEIHTLVQERYLSEGRGKTFPHQTLLSELPVFPKIEWAAKEGSIAPVCSSTALRSGIAYIGLLDLIPMPSSPDICFLEVSSDRIREFYQALDVVNCFSTLDTLTKFVIPKLKAGDYATMSGSLRLKVAEAILKNYLHFGLSIKRELSDLPFLPFQGDESSKGLQFGCAEDMVDPENELLRGLFFDDESFLPEQKLYGKYALVFAECGLTRRLTSSLIESRIHQYESRLLTVDSTALKVKRLLKLSVSSHSNTSGKVNALEQSIAERSFLPVKDGKGGITLVKASQCRDLRDQPLVGHTLPTLPFGIEPSWRPLLGWDAPISVDVLVLQLKESIRTLDATSIDRVLRYLWDKYRPQEYQKHLSGLSWVLSSTNGTFVNSAIACRDSCEDLQPHLFNVDPSFWNKHQMLLQKLDVVLSPDLTRLRRVQETLEAKCPLDDADLDVCIKSMRLRLRHFPGDLKDLKAPDRAGYLKEMHKLTFGEPLLDDDDLLSKTDHSMINDKVSLELAGQLKIQPVKDLMREHELGILDLGDDDYDQREEVADGIRDTLDRYTLISTFQEYIANADDCGASEITFRLDTKTYDKKDLLADGLASQQGPALLVYNDKGESRACRDCPMLIAASVFSEKDFEGLKRVGRGSKRDDPEAIGKFGRGSQTMYHWTDVPMILSGENLAILE